MTVQPPPGGWEAVGAEVAKIGPLLSQAGEYVQTLSVEQRRGAALCLVRHILTHPPANDRDAYAMGFTVSIVQMLLAADAEVTHAGCQAALDYFAHLTTKAVAS